ncbi:hypothetical protein FF38_02576 [Lucilia cuprina]|uniref:Uncharacterized protein n=1 Tax=Lucilia cuprina TaxID=7375 RepID=A0A0L0BZ13_LUCCU|nr:hypothetical protein FF38_02576 [Lucilia cuprina]
MDRSSLYLLTQQKQQEQQWSKNHSSFNDYASIQETMIIWRAKRKSLQDISKERYAKADIILDNAKNVANGIPNVRDWEDRVKYEAVVPKVYKNHSKTTPNPAAQAVISARRSFNKVMKERLMMALANDEEVTNPVATEWSTVESKLTELVIKHLLANEDNTASRFDSGGNTLGIQGYQRNSSANASLC